MTETAKQWGIAVQWSYGWSLVGFCDGTKTFPTKREATEYWKEKIKDSLTKCGLKSKIVLVNVSYQFEA